MNIDMKQLLPWIGFITMLMGAAYGYGLLNSEVDRLKELASQSTVLTLKVNTLETKVQNLAKEVADLERRLENLQ